MAEMLTSSQMTNAWGAAQGARDESIDNHLYFDGDQPILKRNAGKERKNGLQYHRMVPNVLRVIARRHKGFLFGRPMNITLGQDASEAALAEYEKVRRFNNLDKLDADHYLESLLSGSSVEVHSFDADRGPIITQCPAAEWAFVKDEFETVFYAIRKIKFPKSSWFNGQVLESEFTLWTVYSKTHIQMFSNGSVGDLITPTVQSGEDALNSIGGVGFEDDPVTKGAREGGHTGKLNQDSGSSELKPFGPPVSHPYDRVPVFQWTGEEDFEAFFSQDFRSLQDAYNEVLSMLLDDVEGDIEALLFIQGFRQGALTQNTVDSEGKDTGVTLIQEIKQAGGFSTDKDGDAKFLTRGLTADKSKFAQSELRQLLYELGHAPDLSRVVGVTGQTTGIALKLQFQTMIEKSADSTHFIRKSIGERVDLLNRIWEKNTEGIHLAAYNIEFTMLIPVNEIERWENIANLFPLLSAVDLLKLIQSVDDPEESWKRKVAELKSGVVLTPIPQTKEDKDKPNKPEGEGQNDRGTD